VPLLSVGAGGQFFGLVRGPQGPAPDTNLVWIPPGTFTLGSPTNQHSRDDDEGPETLVTLTRGFWIGRFEVTQKEYLELTGSNPSFFNGARDGTNYGVDLDRPVETVSWDDATNYCGLLTLQRRKAGQLPDGWAYRLPTEAEWEFACRASTTTAFHTGTSLKTNEANFDWRWSYDSEVGFQYSESNPFLERTLPVGSFPPNQFGLFDMHGNVWEWTADWHEAVYPGGHVFDRVGPRDGTYKVLRGGGWHIFPWHCRSANRSIKVPWDRSNIRGFRVVVSPAP
jgi:formylglycine-generating enzyme required for sulfatase activity